MADKKNRYRLDRPERVLDTRWGRVDKNTNPQTLGAIVRRCPELSKYIIDLEAEPDEGHKADVTTVRVGGEGETRMVAPIDIEVKPKENPKPKRKRKYTKRKKSSTTKK